jgi:N-methylhydantoinase A
MLLSDVRKEYSRTVMRAADRDLSPLEGLFAELEDRAEAELAAEGIEAGERDLSRWLDVRYRGQSYVLSIPSGRLEPAEVAAAFGAAHRQRYGYASEDAPCEIVNIRLRALGRVPQPRLPHAEPPAAPPAPPSPAAAQRLYADGRWLDCPVYERAVLRPGHALSGPALVTQTDTTTWIPPGWVAWVDGWYNILATRDGA